MANEDEWNATRNKCLTSSNRCLTSSNKKLLGAPCSIIFPLKHSTSPWVRSHHPFRLVGPVLPPVPAATVPVPVAAPAPGPAPGRGSSGEGGVGSHQLLDGSCLHHRHFEMFGFGASALACWLGGYQACRTCPNGWLSLLVCSIGQWPINISCSGLEATYTHTRSTPHAITNSVIGFTRL